MKNSSYPFFILILCVNKPLAQTLELISKDNQTFLEIKNTEKEGILSFIISNKNSFPIKMPTLGKNTNFLTVLGPSGNIYKYQTWGKHKTVEILPGEKYEWVYDLNHFFRYYAKDASLGDFQIEWQVTYQSPVQISQISVLSNKFVFNRSQKVFRQYDIILNIDLSPNKDSLFFTLKNNSLTPVNTSDLGTGSNKIILIDKSNSEKFYFSNRPSKLISIEPGESNSWEIAVDKVLKRLKLESLEEYKISWWVEDFGFYPAENGRTSKYFEREIRSEPIPFSSN